LLKSGFSFASVHNYTSKMNNMQHFFIFNHLWVAFFGDMLYIYESQNIKFMNLHSGG